MKLVLEIDLDEEVIAVDPQTVLGIIREMAIDLASTSFPSGKVTDRNDNGLYRAEQLESSTRRVITRTVVLDEPFDPVSSIPPDQVVSEEVIERRWGV